MIKNPKYFSSVILTTVETACVTINEAIALSGTAQVPRSTIENRQPKSEAIRIVQRRHYKNSQQDYKNSHQACKNLLYLITFIDIKNTQNYIIANSAYKTLGIAIILDIMEILQLSSAALTIEFMKMTMIARSARFDTHVVSNRLAVPR